MFNVVVIKSLHVLLTLYACDSSYVDTFSISWTIQFFLKKLVISSSLRKYIGFKGGKAKVKDTWEIVNKIGIFPTPKASRI